ncbi:serine phosphatase RsbU (regulator of sigma subunit) [Cohnella sp. SGD-V74]|uniref:PP2C family protein-serine/threonine phosphatase n=1 Tax=unclassified Cohnella TaxID=2636738 RepID=UPI000D4EF60D|nr:MULTISPECIES: PP2C family protein-serine/threonine phosphatase [unclassified Cohnella]PRX72147.1 serine phosphatase RsbU (regulator of sigma subunit) [Cohnella sp. SGD-V74]
MNDVSARFWLRLLLVYFAVLSSGAVFIFTNNRVIYGQSFRKLLEFNVPFVLLGCFLLAASLTAAALWRIGPALRKASVTADADKAARFERLARFPVELCSGMLLGSTLLIAAYHAAEAGRRGADVDALNVLVENAIWEFGLASMLAALLLAVTRKLLRPFAEALEIRSLRGFRGRRSAVRFIALATAACFVFSFAPLLKLVGRSEPGAVLAGKLLPLGLTYALFAAGVFTVYILGIRKELRLLLDRLRALAEGGPEGGAVENKITAPLLAPDEIGQVTDAMNALQRRMEAEYADVNRQLQMAYKVQNRLLPKQFPAIEGMELAVFCRMCQEVGGDFYDLIPLGGRRYCIAIGDVSGKGLPAALLMTAMMTGLRAEAARGGTAGDMLSRLNAHVYRMTQGKQYATLGVAVVDLGGESVELEYASAGHLDPYLIRQGQAMAWQFSSYPLGMSPEERYEVVRHRIDDGDIFVLYTDGIIEQGGSSGEMLGFDGWERRLRSIRPESRLEEALAELRGMEEADDGENAEDDRTLLLIRWGDAVAECGAEDEGRKRDERRAG